MAALPSSAAVPGRPSPYVVTPAPVRGQFPPYVAALPLLPSSQLPPYVAAPPLHPPSGQLPPFAAVPQSGHGVPPPTQHGLPGGAPVVVHPPPAADPAQQQLLALQREVQELRRAQGLPGGPTAPGFGQDQGAVQVLQDQGTLSSQVLQQESQVNISLDSLMHAHVKYKQYYAIDFARLSPFPYISQLKPTNLNLSLFAYGSIKHLLALSDGTLPPANKTEFISRLQHLMNTLEIVCLGSSLSDFDSYSWKIAREYDSKVVKDIEQGYKTWENLNRCIDPTAWKYAEEMIPKPSKPAQNAKNSNQNSNQKMCTTYNTFRKEGCSYEHNNPGENIVYVHACSTCRQKGLGSKRHKAHQCPESKPTSTAPVSSAPPTSAVHTPVTSA